jgi:phosphate transport system substrate-binding protein
MLGSLLVLPTGGASGAASCPITINLHGSTTVGPVSDAAKPGFEASRPGTTQSNHTGNPDWEGSGTGINDIRGNLGPGGTQVGQSSRGLSAAEYTGIYVYRFAKDGMVMAVQNSAPMAFISNITSAQVKSIYEGGYTGETWDDFGLGGPAGQQIIMRARITSSGTFPDFISLFGINSGLEATTITNSGLPRLQESVDMANAAAAAPYVISYTSLANLDVPNLKALQVDGVAPSQTSVANGTYPKLRTLHYMTRENASSPTGTLRIDDSGAVLGDDYINYMFSAAGQNLVNVVGFVPIAPGGTATPYVPDWDVNMDGATDIGDLGAITAKWALSTTCNGYIRADANNNNTVSLGDIGTVIGHWGNAGFAPPVYP